MDIRLLRPTDGVSSLWPEINYYFLSFQEAPATLRAQNRMQEIYGNLWLGFDSLTSCEVKDFYRLKLYLQGLDENDAARSEVALLIQAFWAWVNFDYDKARNLFCQHLQMYPTDIPALFCLHMLDFCTGNTPALLGTLEYCAKHLDEEHPLYSFFLAIQAFVLCESQRIEESLLVARRAVQLCPENVYGIHAVAHALHEKGCWQDICQFLEGNKEMWVNNPGMRMHVYWHLALSYEQAHDLERAISTFKQLYALKDSRFAKQDLDAVGFLWRLQLKCPHDQRFDEVWRNLAVLWTGSIGSSTSYFHKLHAALAFAAARQPLFIEKLIAESDGFGVEPVTHRVGVEVLESIFLYATGCYEACWVKLRNSQGQWHLLGGSRAQRELLTLTMDAAAHLSELTRQVVA